MEKIKKILSPGHEHDDNAMYQMPSDSQDPRGSDTAEQSEATKLQTDPEQEKKSHGILRQVLNPHGDKYSEQSYGSTSTAVPAEQVTDQSAHDDGKSHGVLRQIFNPQGEKYSEQSYGAPSEQREGESGPAIAGTMLSRSEDQDDESCLSIKSGVMGPYAGGGADPGLLGAAGSTQSSAVAPRSGTDVRQPAADIPQSSSVVTQPATNVPQSSSVVTQPATNVPQSSTVATQSAADDSHFGRDAAIAGGAGTAAVVGSGAMAREGEKGRGDDVADATFTERAYPVGAPPATTDAAGQSNVSRDAALGSAGVVGADRLAYLPSRSRDDEVSTERTIYPARDMAGTMHSADYSTTAPSGGHSSLGRDAAMGGAGTVGASSLAYQAVQPQPQDQEVANATYTERSYPVGGGTASSGGDLDIASRETPHVPGEFPTATGEDPHAHGNVGLGSAAALGGAGAGAAGLAGYEASKPTVDSTSNTGTYANYDEMKARGDTGPAHMNTAGQQQDPAVTAARTAYATAPAQQTTARQDYESSSARPDQAEASGEGTHYGRDAAVVGGAGAAAGAAGYGAYSLEKAGGDTNQPTTMQQPAASSYTHTSPTVTTTTQTTTQARAPPQQHSTTTTSVQQPAVEQQQHARDATAAGSTGGAGTGAIGTMAYEDTRAPEETAAYRDTRAPEETATGAAATATGPAAAPHDNRVVTDGSGHNKLHKKSVETEGRRQEGEQADDTVDDDEDKGGEKKHGLLSRILHPNRTKQEKEEEEAARAQEQGNLS